MYVYTILNIANVDLTEATAGIYCDGTVDAGTGTLDIDVTKACGVVAQQLEPTGNQQGELTEAVADLQQTVGGNGSHTAQVDGVLAEAGANSTVAQHFHGDNVVFFAEAGAVVEVVCVDLAVIPGSALVVEALDEAELSVLGLSENVQQQSGTENHQKYGQKQILVQQGIRQKAKVAQQEVGANHGEHEQQESKLPKKSHCTDGQQSSGPCDAPQSHIQLQQIGQQPQHTAAENEQGEADTGTVGFVINVIPHITILVGLVIFNGSFVNHFLFGSSQQGVHADAEDFSQPGQGSDIGAGLVVFPLADCLSGDAQLFRKLILGQTQGFAPGADPFAECLIHNVSSCELMKSSYHISPKKLSIIC